MLQNKEADMIPKEGACGRLRPLKKTLEEVTLLPHFVSESTVIFYIINVDSLWGPKSVYR
jgi:hypothetical protein